MRYSASAPRRVWTVLGLALIVLTHHQAAAQVTATTPAGGAAGAPAVTTTAAGTPAAGTPAGGNKAAPAASEAAMWRQMSDSLAKVISETFGSRPAFNASDMVQAANDWIRGAGTGQFMPGGGNMADNLRGAVSNSQLVDAFDQLRSTARGLGMGLPSNSPVLDTWSRLGDALRGGADGRSDFTAALPVLMRNGTGSMAQAAADMGQVADPVTAFLNLPANIRIALATLSNLGLDAFSNGPGAAIALTSLGIGLAASICGIVGGAFFIAGASVLLGAGVDSLDPAKLKEYKDNKYIQEFSKLAAQSQATILPAALNRRNIQLVDLAAQVLNVSIGFVDRQNAITFPNLGANINLPGGIGLTGNLGSLSGGISIPGLGNLQGNLG